MGLDRTIRFGGAEPPAWEGIRAQLGRVSEAAPLRLIDGQPAFPDETPEPGWQEVRIGTAAGMVTIRRQGHTLVCVIWGNASDELKAAWNRVCWACAAAANGVIDTPSGPLTASEFAQVAGVSPV